MESLPQKIGVILKKKRLFKSTCFMMGLVGSVVGAVCGILVFFGVGQALFFRSASLVMIGMMLLFLALAEQGVEHKGKRAKLMGLFFLLVLAYPNLPLLSPATELFVLPLAGLLYGAQKEFFPFWIFLVFSELSYAACQTLALWGGWQAYAMWLSGGGLVLVSVARFLLLLRFYRGAKTQETQGL